MAGPLSLDLRERVVGAVIDGQSCRAVAKRFGVSVASVVKWSQRFRATGSAAAKPMGGKRPYALEQERTWVLARVAQQPDITLRALAEELAERGLSVSIYAVWHFLRREGLSFKKNSARQRARQGRRGPAPGSLAASSGRR
jgi:transposase